jgi:ADP-heptose:LPS heptosyltransferase
MNRTWPSSAPDYLWPEHFKSEGMAVIARCLAAVFYVAYALGSVLRLLTERFYQFEAPPTLLIRTDGIGDALLFEPALESLARTSSPSEIHLWAPKPTCQLFVECPTITRRFPVPRGGKDGNLLYYKSIYWRARIGFELGRWSFERVIYPVESPEPFGNWLFVSARAQERWINAGDTSNQFEWQQARTHEQATRIFEPRPGHAHELLRNEYLTDQWAQERKLRRPRVHLGASAVDRANRLVLEWQRIAQRNGASELAGLVVGGTAHVNHYPGESWAAALRRLWEQQRVMAVLLGGPLDRGAMDEVSRHLHDVPHVRLLRSVDVLTTAAIVRRLDCMLSVDTGLAHIALSMRVPAVVLVGGGHPGRFFPWPGTHQQAILNAPMPCDGCGNRCHLPEPSCITRIAPDAIVEAYHMLRVRNVSIQRFVTPQTQRRYDRKTA